MRTVLVEYTHFTKGIFESLVTNIALSFTSPIFATWLALQAVTSTTQTLNAYSTYPSTMYD